MDKDELRKRQTELIKTVEAIDEVIRSNGWQILREEFEGLYARLEKQLLNEAKTEEPNLKKIYRLQGEMATAKRFDLPTWEERLKKELQGIKINLQ